MQCHGQQQVKIPETRPILSVVPHLRISGYAATDTHPGIILEMDMSALLVIALSPSFGAMR